MIIASVSNVSKSYPSITVLDDVSLAIKKGEKIGFVGANGTGKTTLLEIIYGTIEVDSGIINKVRNLKIAYLPQSPSATLRRQSHADITVFDFIKAGHGEIFSLKSEISELEQKISSGRATRADRERYGKALDLFENLGGYGIEAKSEKIAVGVGLAKELLDRPVRKLSNGQMNRTTLARLLIANPDLMLLDEPTNHLDIEGIEFLENYLSTCSAAAVIVSHDRRFLDRTAEKIWEIYPPKVKVYPGNYSAYLERKHKQDEQALRAYIRQQEFIVRTEFFIRKYIAGQKTKQAKSRRKMLEKLERLKKPHGADKSIKLKFSDVGRSDRIVCRFDDVDFGYDQKPLLKQLSFTIERGDKVGLLGKNGTGKTTILKLITGNLKPDDGQILRGKKINMGYFRQSGPRFNPEDQVIDVVKRVLPDYSEGSIRDFLAKFLFTGEDVFRPVKTFSGGQLSRLVLATLMATKPNFLILDEPTNHLDIPSREALENALENYTGTLLVVSHDRFFLDAIVNKILLLEDGNITTYLGNYSYFESGKQEISEVTKTVERLGKKSIRKPKSKKVNPLIIRKIKEEIKVLEKDLIKVEDNLKSGKYKYNWEKLHILQDEKTELENRLLLLYEQLENISAKE